MTRGDGVEQDHHRLEQLGQPREQGRREPEHDAAGEAGGEAGDGRGRGGAEMRPELAAGEVEHHPADRGRGRRVERVEPADAGEQLPHREQDHQCGGAPEGRAGGDCRHLRASSVAVDEREPSTGFPGASDLPTGASPAAVGEGGLCDGSPVRPDVLPGVLPVGGGGKLSPPPSLAPGPTFRRASPRRRRGRAGFPPSGRSTACAAGVRRRDAASRSRTSAARGMWTAVPRPHRRPGAVAEHGDRIRRADRLLEVVGDEQHREAVALDPVQQLLGDAGPHDGVEGRERLVHEQQPGGAGPAPGRWPPAFAGRRRAGRGSGRPVAGEAQRRQPVVGPGVGVGRGNVPDAQPEGHVLPRRSPRQEARRPGTGSRRPATARRARRSPAAARGGPSPPAGCSSCRSRTGR